MTENRDKLLAQFRRMALVQQRGFALCQFLECVQMTSDQFGKQIEGLDRFGIVETRRARIDRAERAEERSVRQDDRNGDVALKAVHRRGVVAAERLIFRDMIDNHRFVALANLVTDRRFDLQFAARLEAELNFVPSRAAYPSLLGDARDCGEAHAGRPADHIEDLWYGIDTLNRIDVRLKYAFH